MTVTIRVDTGFVGAVYEEDIDLTVEEWKKLSLNQREEYFQKIIEEHLECYAVDENKTIITN